MGPWIELYLAAVLKKYNLVLLWDVFFCNWETLHLEPTLLEVIASEILDSLMARMLASKFVHVAGSLAWRVVQTTTLILLEV